MKYVLVLPATPRPPGPLGTAKPLRPPELLGPPGLLGPQDPQ